MSTMYKVWAGYSETDMPEIVALPVLKTTKTAVWFAERPLAIGCVSRIEHDCLVSRGVADTEAGAVALWQERARKGFNRAVRERHEAVGRMKWATEWQRNAAKMKP